MKARTAANIERRHDHATNDGWSSNGRFDGGRSGFSFFAIFTKFVYDNSTFSPLDILVWRFVISAPITWLAMAWLRRGQSGKPVERLPRGRLISMGLLFGVVLAFMDKAARKKATA